MSTNFPECSVLNVFRSVINTMAICVSTVPRLNAGLRRITCNLWISLASRAASISYLKYNSENVIFHRILFCPYYLQTKRSWWLCEHDLLLKYEFNHWWPWLCAIYWCYVRKNEKKMYFSRVKRTATLKTNLILKGVLCRQCIPMYKTFKTNFRIDLSCLEKKEYVFF